MTSPNRWVGVPLHDRRAERRELLVRAAFALFGEGGDAAVTVRSVCRACELNSRYFYESFATVDDLLGEVYDHVVTRLGEFVGASMTSAADDRKSKTFAGIRAVLQFSGADPRCGRVLFTDARTNPVLVERRLAAQKLLFDMTVEDDERFSPDEDPIFYKVAAAMYTGALTELVHQWHAGWLGSDVDSVVSYAIARIMPDR